MSKSTYRPVLVLLAAATLLLLGEQRVRQVTSGNRSYSHAHTDAPPCAETPATLPIAALPMDPPTAPAPTTTSTATEPPATDTPTATASPTELPATATAPPAWRRPRRRPATPAPSATPPSPGATAPRRQPRPPQPAPAATLPPSWRELGPGRRVLPIAEPARGFHCVRRQWLAAPERAYDPAAPRLNENKYLPNVHSGERSQEISFDWRSGEAGIWRTFEVVPGHRYLIEAWARYVPSESGLALYLGIDLGGGNNFEAGSVTWRPCTT